MTSHSKTNVPGAWFMGLLIGIGVAALASGAAEVPPECRWAPEMEHVTRHLGLKP